MTALFVLAGAVTEFAAAAVAAGAVVVDNSSASDDRRFRWWRRGQWRGRPQAPGTLPTVATTIMLVAVKPLYDISPIRRIVVSTYQSASGAGAKGMEELWTQTADVLAGKPAEPVVFQHPYAFNLFSHNTTIGENGYNEEEMKMVNETRKILHDDAIQVCPTCVRVPVLRSHAESIVVEQARKVSVEEAVAALSKAPGIKVVDDRAANHFPMPNESNDQYDVLVGRIREDLSCANGLALFVCGDQLLKGAALNAVQIAELLV